ncbi:MAG: hypothetical protein V1746_06180, partial [bacterium]
TGLSFRTPDEQRKARALEIGYRLAFSHPSVKAIILWGFFEKTHWMGREASLVDKDWNLLPAGEMLKKLLLKEWRTVFETTTDIASNVKFRGFFGTYLIQATDPNGKTLKQFVHFTPESRGAIAHLAAEVSLKQDASVRSLPQDPPRLPAPQLLSKVEEEKKEPSPPRRSPALNSTKLGGQRLQNRLGVAK